MPRYHFNIDDGKSSPDSEGRELENLQVAKCEAIKLAGREICEVAGEFWDRSEWSMAVTNDQGLTLFTLLIVATEAPAIQIAPTPRQT